MRTITIKHQWARLIHSGKKRIENRTWKTTLGWILLHSGNPDFSILGIMRIDGVIEPGQHCDDKYYIGPSVGQKPNYGWIIGEYLPLKKPIKNIRGKLGIWEYEI